MAASSSSSEDGDAEWKANIESVARATSAVTSSALVDKVETNKVARRPNKGLELSQIKAIKMLHELLDKTTEIGRTGDQHLNEVTQPNESEGLIRLFRRAPPGLTEVTETYRGPLKRPRIHPGEELEEASKKFKHRVRSVVVDGNDVIASGKEARQRSLARYEASLCRAKEASEREADRVLKLKKTRGERWLPSIARALKEEDRMQK